MTTIEKLCSKKQVRTLNIQAAGDIAIQVNEAAASESTRTKDDAVLVAEMELPRDGIKPQAEPDREMEAA